MLASNIVVFNLSFIYYKNITIVINTVNQYKYKYVSCIVSLAIYVGVFGRSRTIELLETLLKTLTGLLYRLRMISGYGLLLP